MSLRKIRKITHMTKAHTFSHRISLSQGLAQILLFPRPNLPITSSHTSLL
ncbi:hypothetical protein [Rubritalea tangerina]